MAAGRGHVYLHGGMGLWDLAAGCLILQEAGGRSCTLQGEPVFLPRVEKRSVIAAGDPAVFDAWRNWLGA
jgi:myo-inositol-1(or 4)-monophosphatase